MRVPGKIMTEQIVERHAGRKIRITNEASKLIILHYVIFLKKLARECDNYSFRHRKVQIKGDAVSLVSPKLLTAFCETEKIKQKAPMRMQGKKTPEKQQHVESKAEDEYEPFNEDTSETEETE